MSIRLGFFCELSTNMNIKFCRICCYSQEKTPCFKGFFRCAHNFAGFNLCLLTNRVFYDKIQDMLIMSVAIT